MKKITSIDRKSATVLHAAMEKALQSVAAQYGVVITKAGGSVGMVEATFKFDVRPVADSKGRDPREVEFREWAKFFGGNPNWYGKGFATAHGNYKVVGLLRNSRKYPFLCQRRDGKDFKFSGETLSMLVK